MLLQGERDGNLNVAHQAIDADNIQNASAKRALELAVKHGTPLDPKTFSVWYYYAARNCQSLTDEVDSRLQRRTVLSSYDIEQLFAAFCTDIATEESQEEIGHALTSQLDKLAELVRDGESAHLGFADKLDDIRINSESIELPAVIKSVVGNLSDIVKAASLHSRQIGDQLQTNREQVRQLNLAILQLEQENASDPLTQVANRRAFDRQLKIEQARSSKNGKNLCLVMADIDHFKRVNDTFGHLVGDSVLREFANLLREHTKGRDLVARYGGEEFAIILPETNIVAAHNLMINIKHELQNMRLVTVDGSRSLGEVTASFGIAIGEVGDSRVSLVGRADAQLYEAKRAGRNRVACEGLQ